MNSRRWSVLLADDEPLARRGLVQHLERHPDFEVVGESGDGANAVERVLALRPDVLFLDVEMPELDGFEVLEALSPDERPLVVFVTAFDRYAVQAFDAHALDYVVKPIDPARLDETLARVRDELGRATSDALLRLERRLEDLLERVHTDRRGPERIALRAAGSLQLVPQDEIDWVEAADNYVRVHTGGRVHLARQTLGRLERRLDPSRFQRVHRSAIVRLAAVREVVTLSGGEAIVRLADGTDVPVSRRLRPALEERLVE